MEDYGKKGNQPAHEIGLGCIRASIWSNQSKTGRPWFTVTTSRSYKDGEGSWNDSKSFRDYDLPILGDVLEMAQAWIREQFYSIVHDAVPIHAMDEAEVVRVGRKTKRKDK